MTPLRYGGIGLRGTMLGSAHKFSSGVESPAFCLRAYRRGPSSDPAKCSREAAWGPDAHGAIWVESYDELLGEKGSLDGIIFCGCKNNDGDVIKSLVPRMREQCTENPFFVHFSTLGVEFVLRATSFCREQGVSYANVPLTGGPAGAEAGTMLMLASGDRDLYQRMLPFYHAIGTPMYCGKGAADGAATKLIGHLLVFNGLLGVAAAVALHAEYFQKGELGGQAQSEFFDMLACPPAAGASRQYEVAMRKMMEEPAVYDAGFFIDHAVVDSYYLLDFCIKRGLSKVSISGAVVVALSLTYLVRNFEERLATHAIVREFVSKNREGIDAFVDQHFSLGDPQGSMDKGISLLPDSIRDTVQLDYSF